MSVGHERAQLKTSGAPALDWLTFGTKLVGTLAWPAVLLFVLWLGRDRIPSLLDRLENFEGWGAKLTFGKQLDQLEKQLDRVEAPPSPSASSVIVEATPDRASLSAVAELPPAYIVQEAWKRVDQAIREAAAKRGLPPSDEDFFPFVSYLVEVGALRLLPEERSSIIELHNLRNRAVHSLDPQITITDALRYHDIANRLTSVIKERLAPPSQ